MLRPGMSLVSKKSRSAKVHDELRIFVEDHRTALEAGPEKVELGGVLIT